MAVLDKHVLPDCHFTKVCLIIKV